MHLAILLLLTGLFLECASTHAEPASAETSRLRAAGDPYATHIAEASRRFGISAHWIRAVMDTESGGNSNAVSAAGAMGLMKVRPETWEELRIRYGLDTDPFEPHDNILAGTAYLREMFDHYGDITGMLTAYNAGPARYDAFLEDCRALPSETRTYVALLAPALGGHPLPDVGGASACSPDWREASLFAGLKAAGAYANRSLFGGSSSVAPNAAETGRWHTRAGAAETLFVPRSPGEGFR